MTEAELLQLAADQDTPNEILLDAISDLPDEVRSKMATIYLVMGRTGSWSYEDYEEWPVAGFFDRDSATEMMTRLDKWCFERNIHRGERNPVTRWNGHKPEEDPRFRCGSNNGTSYDIYEIPLKG